jgi:hypothetical protein
MAVCGCGCVDGGGGGCEGRGAVLDQIDDLMWEWEVMGTHVGHRSYQQPTCTSNRHGQQSGQLGPTGTAFGLVWGTILCHTDLTLLQPMCRLPWVLAVLAPACGCCCGRRGGVSLVDTLSIVEGHPPLLRVHSHLQQPTLCSSGDS